MSLMPSSRRNPGIKNPVSDLNITQSLEDGAKALKAAQDHVLEQTSKAFSSLHVDQLKDAVEQAAGDMGKSLSDALSPLQDMLGNLTSGLGLDSLMGDLMGLLGKAGSMKDMLGGLMGTISGLMPNTSDSISKMFSMFNGSDVCDPSFLSFRLGDYNNSLNRLLNFNINGNMCGKGLAGNPLSALLRAVNTLDTAPSLFSNFNTGVIANYANRFTSQMVGLIGLPPEIERCIGARNRLGLGNLYGNNGSLASRIGLMDLLNGALGCNVNLATRATMLGRNNSREFSNVRSQMAMTLFNNMAYRGLDSSSHAYNTLVGWDGSNKRFTNNGIMSTNEARRAMWMGVHADGGVSPADVLARNKLFGYSKEMDSNNPYIDIYSRYGAEAAYEAFRLAQGDTNLTDYMRSGDWKLYFDAVKYFSLLSGTWLDVSAYFTQNDPKYNNQVLDNALKVDPNVVEYYRSGGTDDAFYSALIEEDSYDTNFSKYQGVYPNKYNDFFNNFNDQYDTTNERPTIIRVDEPELNSEDTALLFAMFNNKNYNDKAEIANLNGYYSSKDTVKRTTRV